MEQWSSGYGAGFPVQGSHVQNHWVDSALHPSKHTDAYIPVQNSHYNPHLHPLCIQMQGIN